MRVLAKFETRRSGMGGCVRLCMGENYCTLIQTRRTRGICFLKFAPGHFTFSNFWSLAARNGTGGFSETQIRTDSPGKAVPRWGPLSSGRVNYAVSKKGTL